MNQYEREILSAPGREFKRLSWTHIINLLPIKDELKRKFYATFCLKERWSTRTLQNRISSMLFERTALSKLPEKTIENQLKELKEEDRIKVAEYLTKLPLKELIVGQIELINEYC